MQRLLTALLLVFLACVVPARASLDSLLSAAMQGDVAKITEYLDAGVPVDGDGDGYSALMFAAGYGQVEAVRLLLARGANPAYRDHNSDRAMLWAAEKGHAGVVELLLAAGDTADSPLDPYGQSPLHEAALWGHVDTMRLLLAAGANPNNREQTEDTPLHAATTYGFPAAVALLLAAGSDPNAVEEVFGRTPVHQAAEDEDPEALRRLIAAGGDFTRGDRDGKTPLHYAATLGMAGTAALLVEAGAAVDAKDKDGTTPFAMAASSRNERVEDFRAVVNLLANHVSDLDGAFAEAVWGGHAQAARRLAERGANATGKDGSGRSALAGAAMNAGLSVFELALARGANVDTDGPEALNAAAFAGREDIAKRLIGLGVPVDARTEAGRTPLQLAAAQGHVSVAALLIDRGADTDPRDFQGHSIEDLMRIWRDMIQAFIDQANQSRALIPTEHLKEELARLNRNHKAILALLGR